PAPEAAGPTGSTGSTGATGTAPRPAAALVTIAVAVPLGALRRLVAVPALAHGADREVDPAHAVDLGDLHRHLVADVHDVLDAVHPLGRELAHAHEALFPGEVFDEGADAHDPRNLALVDLAD